MAVRVLMVLAAFTVLYGCGQASSPVEKQEKKGGVEEVAPTTKAEQQAPTPVKGNVGEMVDVGSATILVPKAFKTENNPKIRSLKFEGTFVLVQLTYTPGGNQPVQIPDPLPLTLKDSEGLFYATDVEQGIAGAYAYNKDLGLSEGSPTVNPGVPWETVVAFPVTPDASGFTLKGGDLACPQMREGFRDRPRLLKPRSSPKCLESSSLVTSP